jgi:hypothetical protein
MPEYNETHKGHQIKITVSEVRIKEFRGEWLSSFSIAKPDKTQLGLSGPGRGISEEEAKQHALKNARDNIDKHLGLSRIRLFKLTWYSAV